MLKCSCIDISLPKIGHSSNENEDNILVPSRSEITKDPVRFAISDGATESSFSKEWSCLLVNCYKDKSFDKDHLPDTIKEISDKWQSAIPGELPWYAQQKAEYGAFATFLGITLNLTEKEFEVIAIGDCTLFQIRNQELELTFPIEENEEYGNTPNLFSTNPKYQTDFEKTVRYYKGSILKGDLIILATDALAAWIFQRINKKERHWYGLITLINREDYRKVFPNWIKDKIKKKEIKNDDISLVIINIE